MLALALMMPTACLKTLTTADNPVTDVTCQTQCQVQYSLSKDSPETIAQVRGNNAAYGAICPPKKCIIDSQAVAIIKGAQSLPAPQKSPAAP